MEKAKGNGLPIEFVQVVLSLSRLCGICPGCVEFVQVVLSLFKVVWNLSRLC